MAQGLLVVARSAFVYGTHEGVPFWRRLTEVDEDEYEGRHSCSAAGIGRRSRRRRRDDYLYRCRSCLRKSGDCWGNHAHHDNRRWQHLVHRGRTNFTGLWLGGDNSSGTYTLAFSSAITSIEIEFDAFSDIGGGAVETIFNFANNLGGVTIAYVNQFGTTFDGTTITSTENDGQGIMSFAGPAFLSFFVRSQPGNAGRFRH